MGYGEEERGVDGLADMHTGSLRDGGDDRCGRGHRWLGLVGSNKRQREVGPYHCRPARNYQGNTGKRHRGSGATWMQICRAEDGTVFQSNLTLYEIHQCVPSPLGCSSMVVWAHKKVQRRHRTEELPLEYHRDRPECHHCVPLRWSTVEGG